MQMVMILTAPPQGLIPLLPTMQIVLILPIYIYIYKAKMVRISKYKKCSLDGKCSV